MEIPAHPLLVHASVIFVPLLLLLASAYALVPGWRSRMGWAVASLAIATPIVTFLSKESGESLEELFEAKGYPAEIMQQVEQHAEYADALSAATLLLAITAGVLVAVMSRPENWPGRVLPSWSKPVLTVAVLILAVAAGVTVFLTGHSGALAVWQGVS